MTLRGIRRLFERALEVPVEGRSAFLNGSCAGDENLGREMERLLRADTENENFSSDAALPALAMLYEDRIGSRLGPYRLLRLIGQGGMGLVYLAERVDEAFDKQVAVKVLRWSDAGLGQWMHGERQILARLEHPHIARLLDGGTTGDGSPYLVMEYVEGLPITSHCDRQ